MFYGLLLSFYLLIKSKKNLYLFNDTVSLRNQRLVSNVTLTLWCQLRLPGAGLSGQPVLPAYRRGGVLHRLRHRSLSHQQPNTTSLPQTHGLRPLVSVPLSGRTPRYCWDCLSLNASFSCLPQSHPPSWQSASGVWSDSRCGQRREGENTFYLLNTNIMWTVHFS